MCLHYVFRVNSEAKGLVRFDDKAALYSTTILDSEGTEFPTSWEDFVSITKIQFETYQEFGIPVLEELSRRLEISDGPMYTRIISITLLLPCPPSEAATRPPAPSPGDG